MATKRTSIALLLLCEVGAMAVWFSSSAVVARLQATQDVPSTQAVLLTTGVQVGFVAGTILNAALSLPDRMDPRRLFMLSALVAAIATASLAMLPPTGPIQVALRIVSGACMAGVYPVGMRIAATWAKADLGLLIGLLVGALTLGSASPHLLAAVPDLQWRTIYAVAAALAAGCGLLVTLVTLGPNLVRAPGIDLRRMAQAWRSRPLRLVNAGYLGHMWELYAMWTWLGAFLQQTFQQSGAVDAASLAEAAAFGVVAIGAVGAALGGLLADRLGRATITIAAMATSAACALAIGWLQHAPLPLLLAVAVLWGLAVIADSAQFSASIAELADPDSIGTLLTIQTCAGFLLTLVSIQAVPIVVARFGWPGAFSMLAIGPILGCLAMLRLRQDLVGRRRASA